MKKIANRLLVTIFVVVALGVINSFIFVPELEQQGEIVAYRGGGSLVDYDKLGETGCTAKSLIDSGVDTVENTLEAVVATAEAGTDVIHLNVHRTNDDQLVVFHDWTLDCATNAIGAVNQSSFDDLKDVDAGFGYTFDDGATFPFRGKDYRISKLQEYYSLYPNYKFWLNLKNNDSYSFDVLYTFISNLPSILSEKTMIITSSKGIKWFNSKDLSVNVASVSSVKSCGFDYLLVGWAGVVPESCKNTTLLIPTSKAKYFWGYPKRLASRFQNNGSKVYLWSKHQPIDPKLINVVKEGVGVVTSDLHFINKAQANKRVN